MVDQGSGMHFFSVFVEDFVVVVAAAAVVTRNSNKIDDFLWPFFMGHEKLPEENFWETCQLIRAANNVGDSCFIKVPETLTLSH